MKMKMKNREGIKDIEVDFTLEKSDCLSKDGIDLRVEIMGLDEYERDYWGGKWYVLTIHPDGVIVRHGAIPSQTGLDLDGGGQVNLMNYSEHYRKYFEEVRDED